MHVRIFPRDWATRTAARHEQNIAVLAVAADVSGDDTVRAATMTQNGSASAIPKKDAGVAIGPVRDRCQFLGPDHEHRVVCMGGDELLCDLQAEQEPSARCGNVEASSVGGPDLLLNEAGRGREKHVGSGRCHDNEIDLFW